MSDETSSVADTPDDDRVRTAQIIERFVTLATEREQLEAQVKPHRRGRDAELSERRTANQEALEELLEEALSTPLVVRALAEAGRTPSDLHEAGQRGDWADRVVPVIEAARPMAAPTNRIEAADGAESPAAKRQLADLAEGPTGQPPQGSDREPGLLARLRGMIDRGERGRGDAMTQEKPEEELPEALRRRYAVHVAQDGRSIQLFERDKKTPAITLDTRTISTPYDRGAVVTDIVTLARDRGWQALKVSGTADFKDAVWLESKKLGLAVEHDASPATRASFAKWDRERAENLIQQASPPRDDGSRQRQDEALANAFMAKSPEERLADPRLRNAQLELMVGVRTAERELHKPIAELPDVAKALTATIRDQLAQGRAFDAPFVKAAQPRQSAKPVQNPKIDADRIPPPRP